MKFIVYMATVLLIFSGCSKHDAVRFNTKEELVSHYITSVNNKDIVMLKKAYHPQLLKMITDDNADFFKDLFAKELSRTIPAERSISYRIIGDSNNSDFSNLFFNDAFDYPVAPTLSCEINYNKSEYSFVTMYLYLSDTKDGWFLIFPVPKQETLIKYRQAKIDKEKKAEYVAKMIDTMDPQIYTNIVQQLKQKSLTGAISVFKEAYGGDMTTAVLVVEEIQRREYLEW
jgi:hypothetical protein